jgi:hypothetical protein
MSSNLNRGMQLFIERMDMTQRDRELFYDLIGFAYQEGKIAGKEEIINENSKENLDEK